MKLSSFGKAGRRGREPAIGPAVVIVSERGEAIRPGPTSELEEVEGVDVPEHDRLDLVDATHEQAPQAMIAHMGVGSRWRSAVGRWLRPVQRSCAGARRWCRARRPAWVGSGRPCRSWAGDRKARRRARAASRCRFCSSSRHRPAPVGVSRHSAAGSRPGPALAGHSRHRVGHRDADDMGPSAVVLICTL